MHKLLRMYTVCTDVVRTSVRSTYLVNSHVMELFTDWCPKCRRKVKPVEAGLAHTAFLITILFASQYPSETAPYASCRVVRPRYHILG